MISIHHPQKDNATRFDLISYSDERTIPDQFWLKNSNLYYSYKCAIKLFALHSIPDFQPLHKHNPKKPRFTLIFITTIISIIGRHHHHAPPFTLQIKETKNVTRWIRRRCKSASRRSNNSSNIKTLGRCHPLSVVKTIHVCHSILQTATKWSI